MVGHLAGFRPIQVAAASHSLTELPFLRVAVLIGPSFREDSLRSPLPIGFPLASSKEAASLTIAGERVTAEPRTVTPMYNPIGRMGFVGAETLNKPHCEGVD